MDMVCGKYKRNKRYSAEAIAVPGLVYPLVRVVRRFSAAFAAPKGHA